MYQWISWNKHLPEGRVKCLLLLTPLPKQINPQKTENNHEALQTAQERRDLSSVVHRRLGPENHYEPMKILAVQYISHHLSSPLHRKYCFQSFVNLHHCTFCRPLQHDAGMNSPLFSTSLKPQNYCATTGTHRWKISCLYCTKSMLSNYTNKEEVFRRAEKVKLSLGHSEMFLWGNWGPVASSPEFVTAAPLTHCQTSSLWVCSASTTHWMYLPKLTEYGVFPDPSRQKKHHYFRGWVSKRSACSHPLHHPLSHATGLYCSHLCKHWC